MSEDTKESAIALAIVAMLCLLLLLASWGLSAVVCWGHWYGSGMGRKYRPISGCLVEVKPGQWMPEKSVRGFQ